MSVKVKLPQILRKQAGGEAVVQADGSTLRELLKDLESRYPGITKNVVSEDGALHRFINVYVNDEDVRYLGSLETPVTDGDVVSLLPAVAGGAATDRSFVPLARPNGISARPGSPVMSGGAW